VPSALLVLLAAAGIAAGSLLAAPAPRPAPTLSLPALDGTAVSLDALRGRVVVVNFWATWCPPCRAEIPDLATFARAQGDDGAILLGVNALSTETSLDTVRAWVEANGVAYAVPLDRDGAAARAWGVQAWPTTFVVDPRGRIRATRTGAVDAGWLRRAVRAAAGR
jgi:thiol-disulfide isomerase/thioredoxin